MTANWQSLSNVATVIGAIVAFATSTSLALLWLAQRREKKRRLLSVSIERAENDLFFLVVRYTPHERNQAHFVDVGSLGDNPIYLLPRAQSERNRKENLEQFGQPSWPKKTGQWTGGRLRSHPCTESLSTKFQIIPETTDAAGWLHVRVYTKGPVNRTLVRRRVAVSLLE